MAAQHRLPDGVPVRQGRPCPGCGDPGCGVVYRRLLRGRSFEGLACDQPLQLVSRCGYTRHVSCRQSRPSRCQPCASSYRRYVQRVIESGLSRHAGRFVYLFTTTGLGDGPHKRWTPSQAWKPGQWRPDCTCHEGAAIADWNAAAGRNWNRLRTALRDLDPTLEFCRVTEPQKRGALHHHTLIVSTVRLDPLVLQRLALAAGYGCVTDLRPVESSDALRGYLTKRLGGYLTKATEDRDLVPWRADVADETTGEIRKMHTRPTYRTHSESRGWGLTVKAIRQAIREHVQRQQEAAAATPLVAWPVTEVSPHRQCSVLEHPPP